MTQPSDISPAELMRRRRWVWRRRGVGWTEVHRCDNSVGAWMMANHLAAYGLHGQVKDYCRGKVVAYSTQVPAEEADEARAVIQKLADDGEIELPPPPHVFSDSERRAQDLGLLIFPAAAILTMIVLMIWANR